MMTIHGGGSVREQGHDMEIKFKHVCREVDRHYRVRLYYRKGKGPRIALEGEPGSDEFLASYLAAKEAKQPPPARSRRPVAKPRTLRWLCELYFGSADFLQLDERTRRVRRQIIEHCLHEPIEPGSSILFADFPLDRFGIKAMKVLRDRKMALPAAANGRVKALRQVFVFAMDEEDDRGEPLMTMNPARDVRYLKGNVGGIHAWTLAEVEKFEKCHPIGTKARLAFALLLYTAQRRSDIIQFGRQHVRDGWLRFTQFKGRTRNPVTLEIPIIPALQQIIDVSPTGDLTFLVNDLGRAFTQAGFGNKMRQWCDEAGLPDCSAHGLRKATAARLAELGCSDREIMAVTGHQTEKEVTRYTRSARQKVMAKSAMKKLARNAKRTNLP